jgi:hypothetical protein
MNQEMLAKLEAFTALVEKSQKAQMFKEFPDNHQMSESAGARLVLGGSKFAKVDVISCGQQMGRYMVALVDVPQKGLLAGDIVGIKAYGVPHIGYRYGNLDTTSEYNWGGYRATRK